MKNKNESINENEVKKKELEIFEKFHKCDKC